MAYVDQDYTGQNAAQAAEKHAIRLEVVKHTEAKRGFVLLPLGGGKKLCKGGSISQTGQRLRAPLHLPRRLPLLRLCLAHARATFQTTQPKFITGSEPWVDRLTLKGQDSKGAFMDPAQVD
jgi:hypothetical protein